MIDPHYAAPVQEQRTRDLADLLVHVGANVQPGQVVAVSADPSKQILVRHIAESAYRRGAKFVDVSYFDGHVKRVRIEHAPEDTLAYVPPWYGQRFLALGAEGAALVALTPRVTPGLLSDVDPERAGRDLLPALKESSQVINERSINWTVGVYPTSDWAEVVHPHLDPGAALARLWDEIVFVCCLDEPDPRGAWRERSDFLDAVAARLDARTFDALHFEGDGTDLTIGLLPSSRWYSARFSRKDGLPHMVNIPSEEIFTAPDPERVEGTVRATKPLEIAGTLVDGLTVRFEGGRAVAMDARTGIDTLRARASRDEGAARLGEVALVDRDGRVGQAGTVFFDTLLDENAASHIALGSAYAFSVGEEDLARVNTSEIHIDFMIGGDGVDVTGLTREGDRVPVLRGGSWAI